MSVALDTNILIYAHFQDSPYHEKTRLFLKRLLEKPDSYYMSWQIYYEYIRLVTHPKILKQPLSAEQAMNDIGLYQKDSRCIFLQETKSHSKIFIEIVRAFPTLKGNLIHDAHYATLLKEHGVQKIVTADMDFKKFDFLEVINPIV